MFTKQPEVLVGGVRVCILNTPHSTPPFLRQGYDVQMQYIESLCPLSLSPDRWAAIVEERSRSSGRMGADWDERVYTWVCLHSMLVKEEESRLADGTPNGIPATNAATFAATPATPATSAGLGRRVPGLYQFLLSMLAIESK